MHSLHTVQLERSVSGTVRGSSYAGADMDTLTVPGLARSLAPVLGRWQRGAGDPTLRRVGEDWWRATTTPHGPALLRLRPLGDDVVATGWGDGLGWAMAQVPRLVGAEDTPGLFRPEHPVLARRALQHPPRLGATGQLAEALAPTIIEQRVTGAEAFTSIRRLTRRFGTPAPGTESASHPAHRLACPPDAAGWAAIPLWEYLQAGVEEQRARVVVRAMGRVAAIERHLARRPDEDVTARGEALEAALRLIQGVGPWTAAKVRQQVLGDPDAWSIGDYHVPGFIAHHLGGDPVETLEPYRPHRYRVEITLSGLARPERHGPRRTLPTHLPVRGGWGNAGGGRGR